MLQVGRVNSLELYALTLEGCQQQRNETARLIAIHVLNAGNEASLATNSSEKGIKVAVYHCEPVAIHSKQSLSDSDSLCIFTQEPERLVGRGQNEGATVLVPGSHTK